MDSTYWISLTYKSMSFSNLGFIYDTTLIHRYYFASINDHNLNSQYDVKVYPNPFKDNATFFVSNPDNEKRLITIKIYDVVGRTVKEISSENSEYIGITSDGMTKGLYIYELKVNQAIISSGKIIVN